MTYFRNKFNEEFLFLANEQTPKGGSIRLDDENPLFFIIDKRTTKNQPHTTRVIPLLLYNKITSTNMEDKNIEDYFMLCQEKNDTIVSCKYDENYITEHMDYTCNIGIPTITGDLSGDEEI